MRPTIGAVEFLTNELDEIRQKMGRSNLEKVWFQERVMQDEATGKVS